MASELATIDDLADLLPNGIPAGSEARYQRLLNRAAALVRKDAPHTDARIADGTLDPIVVSTVVAGIVKRFLVNPEGASSKSVATGPYSTSLSYVDRYEGSDGSLAIRGGMQVTKADLAQLRPYATPGSRMGTIKLKPALAPSVGIQGDRLVDEGLAGYPDTVLDDPTSPTVVTPVISQPVEP